MIAARSCIHFRCICPLPKTLPFPFSLISPSSRRHFLSLNLSSTRKTMSSSSRPSAFDALMSNARAAAAKKKTTPQPSTSSRSPKKRKAENAQPTDPAKASVSESVVAKSENSRGPITDSTKLSSNSSPIADDSKNEGKKLKVLSQAEKITELKSKIGLLKKKTSDFDPKAVSCWEKGERVPFLFLCLAFDMISHETGRIVITDILCNMLRTVIATTPEDLVATVSLSANEIAPAHEGLELGIGDASIKKALAEAFGRTEKQVDKEYKELGDLGLVAKASRSSQSMMRKPEPLTIVKVFDTFRLIAKEAGKDSQEKKKNRMKALLVAATDCEPQYLTRLLQAKLRIGFSVQTLLAALGQAAVYNEEHSKPPPNIQSPLEEAAKIVKQVYTVLPVYDKIVPALLSGGIWNLPKTCNFTLGVPIGPMLAKPTKGVAEILNKFQDIVFTCEYKYDGERAQIHYMEDGSFEIYSRNAERNTGKFPDVALALSRLKKPSLKSFVLDCELVAYDREKKKILPFQILSTRARKNVSVNDIKVDVCIFAFDMLYLNGQQLLQENLSTRREKLYDSFEEEPGYFQFATALTSSDIEEIQKFLDAAVDSSCEGLIIKTMDLDATYEPAKRSNNWLKLKKDYMDSIGDSVDLVPIGAFHGRGKRTGVYGAFLLACYDTEKEEYQSICKIGTGFSEVVLEERSSSLRSKTIPAPKPYYRVGDTLNPDVWFEPTEVWEVKAADLTISPVHRAAIGIVDPDKGISLRFPRLVRVREDKQPEEATSSEQIADMYQAQKHNHPNKKDDSEDE
ncbi:PREDICTED: DNA ligase 1 [Tarenaya hassleriana]|uniref:DNA ligase 1 n=1 Tax=Tarenaya hassleriana TaxID=28532 RepID=UPI00053C96BC|nr:PREDICTED: DNA ligase 1 [Tarenaya hassleriana]